MNYYIADGDQIERIDMTKSSFDEARQSMMLMVAGEWRSIKDIHEGDNDDIQIELYGRWYQRDTDNLIAKAGETIDKIRTKPFVLFRKGMKED